MLTKNQIRFLKAQAHHLHPVVMIGAQGLTAGIDREVNLALNSHELIKVKLGNTEDEHQAEMIKHICNTHHADFIQKIGHIAVFYRHNPQAIKFILPKN